ncbi:hypothetical protein H5410_045534 [Solanum commersonii]|uniref:Uncharacterized protein n=1 Tax=Solanum commersonii TaxID=4109 RepID=A0A9J5XD10_SOLCO|nr:hypothetical protein H5410_045534 [Solanum commersonii]
MRTSNHISLCTGPSVKRQLGPKETPHYNLQDINLIYEMSRQSNGYTKPFDNVNNFILVIRNNIDIVDISLGNETVTHGRCNALQNAILLSKHGISLFHSSPFMLTIRLDFVTANQFGWDGRMKVATQLASLFMWFHERRYAFGTVRQKDIMIDKDFNIKVFDFGFLTSVTNEDNWGPLPYRAIQEPPEARCAGGPM